MNASASKGNDSERWGKLLAILDERMQLGLLGRLERVDSYHFENDCLYIEPGNQADYEYLTKTSTLQQLELFVQDACKVNSVQVKSRIENLN